MHEPSLRFQACTRCSLRDARDAQRTGEATSSRGREGRGGGAQEHELKLLQLERGQLARRDEELRSKLASFNAQVPPPAWPALSHTRRRRRWTAESCRRSRPSPLGPHEVM